MTSSGQSQPPAALALVDRSKRERFGCTGPVAERWLRSVGFQAPADPNRWHALPSGTLVARIAKGEFLVEGSGADDAAVASARLRLERPERDAGVYPVARQDLVIELSQPGLLDCLRQAGTFDFRPVIDASDASGGPVVLTSLIGVPVVALFRSAGHAPGLVLWIDPSYAHYFWTTMRGIVEDCGGTCDTGCRKEI